MSSSLVHSPRGDYRFLAAEGRPFSGGAVADSGFDMIHATFERPVPLQAGLAAAARHVAGAGRPVESIAGFELRIPRPLTPAAFAEFNRPYVESLRGLGLEVDGLMTAGRTNVSPTVGTVREPSVFGFTFTVPGGRGRPAFLLAGVAEEVPGDTPTMLRNITGILGDRAQQLGCRLSDATVVQLYAEVGVGTGAVGDAMAAFGEAAILGLRWFPSLPPIDTLKFEIDARSTGAESIISR